MTDETDIMQGLRALADKINRARFYISLKGDGISSGFYAEAQTRADAQREARAHKAKYPIWQSATVRSLHLEYSTQGLEAQAES